MVPYLTRLLILEKRGETMTAATADAAQAEGVQDTVGATAGIADKIQEGMDAEKYLDAIMSNVYRDNPVKRAQWKTARHVKRAPQPPPPTPPTP